FESRQETSHKEDDGNSGSVEPERIVQQTDGPRPLKHRRFAQHPRKKQGRERNAQRLNLGASGRGGVTSDGAEIKWAEDET
ncbi:unnamed protein product, partial [Ectocarpus sp. 13 AM-2016]